MTEATSANASSGDTANSSAAGIPYYEKQRQHLKELIFKRKQLEKKLVCFYSPFISRQSKGQLF
jgi:chromatin modification-related protein EAF6